MQAKYKTKITLFAGTKRYSPYLSFRLPHVFFLEEELSVQVADINGVQVDL